MVGGAVGGAVGGVVVYVWLPEFLCDDANDDSLARIKSALIVHIERLYFFRVRLDERRRR